MAHQHDHGGHGHGHEHRPEPATSHHDHGHGGFGHSHAHHFHPRDGRAARRALLIALFLNLAFLVVEAAVGYATGSLALLSDAAHMLSDVAALALAFTAAILTLRPATPGRTFGFLRAEVLGAFLNAVTLVVACVLIFKEAIARLISGPPAINAPPVLIVAVLGLMINAGSAWVLWRTKADDLNTRGAMAHMFSDALGSVGAIASAVLTMTLGWTYADPIASILTGFLVLWTTWSILRDSTRVLLEFAPPGLGQDVVARALEAIEGVAEVHELHVWTLTSGQAAVTAHLVPAADAAPFEVVRRAEAVLRGRLGIHHTTLQVDDPAETACSQRKCPMLSEL